MQTGPERNNNDSMVAVVETLQADRRPVMNVPRQVLDAFDGLVANEDKKRTAAAMVILQHVDQVLRGEGQVSTRYR